MSNELELVDQLDGKTYILTAPRTRATWRVQRGINQQVVGKRFRQGEPVIGLPEHALARLVELGHAVPEDEYDPEALRIEKLRKRMTYDQNAASTAMLEFTLAKNRQAAGLAKVGLPDADAPAKLTDSGYEVDGIKVEDVDGSGVSESDDDDLVSTEQSEQGEAPADYRSMDYPSLQQYAKEVTGSGAGGKEEIYARLDEHFQQ